MRILRLVLGVVILVQGILARDLLSVFLGLALGGSALANIGCCGSNGCAVDTTSKNTKECKSETQGETS